VAPPHFSTTPPRERTPLYTQSYSDNGTTWNSGNVAVGYQTLYFNQPDSSLDGIDNTAVGTQALYTNSTGAYNTAVGVNALHGTSTGSGNYAAGVAALFNNTTGSNNTASGYQALTTNATGSSNTALGYGADVSSGTLTNATAIGNGASVSASNTMVFGNASVTGWGFGANVSSGKAIVVGTNGANGNAAYLTTGGAWTNASDRNVKEGISPVDGGQVLAKVVALPVSQWSYKGEDPAHRHIGPMAQDFHAAFGLGDDDRHISTIDPAGVALVSIQELAKENAGLKQRLAEMESRLAKIEQFIPAARVAADQASQK
jgi:endosialidase-like protein